MKKQIKEALEKLGCTFRDCPKCAEVINAEVVGDVLTFTDSFNYPTNYTLPSGYVDYIMEGANSGYVLKGVGRATKNPIGSDAVDFSIGQYGASGVRAVAFGTNNEATGQEATVFGLSNNSNGFRTFVAGLANTVTGKQGTGFGQGNTGSGEIAFVAGYFNTVAGNRAFALGTNNHANGFASGAFGFGTEANGEATLSTGRRTIANRAHSLVGGSYNIGKPTSVVEFGIGTADNTRLNAFEVNANGTADLPESTIAKIDVAGPKTLVTKEYHNQNIGSLGFAINGAEQIMSGTEIQVAFGTSLSTPEITIDNALSSITVQKAGVYKVTYKINMEDRTDQRQNALCIVKINGVLVPESKAYTYVRNIVDGLATAQFHGAKVLAVGDVVTFHTTNIGLSNINNTAILANESFFQVEYTPNLTIGGA